MLKIYAGDQLRFVVVMEHIILNSHTAFELHMCFSAFWVYEDNCRLVSNSFLGYRDWKPGKQKSALFWIMSHPYPFPLEKMETMIKQTCEHEIRNVVLSICTVFKFSILAFSAVLFITIKRKKNGWMTECTECTLCYWTVSVLLDKCMERTR